LDAPLKRPRPLVLIIEDASETVEAFEGALRQDGFDCLKACDGVTGKEYYDRYLPDAVVMDIKTARIPGLTVLRHIKSKDPFAVVIILETRGTERHVLEAYRQGISDSLKKPVDPSLLSKTVSSAINRAKTSRTIETISILPNWEGGDVAKHILFDAPVALLHVSREGKVLFANRRASSVLGIAPETLSGYDVRDFVLPHISENWLNAVFTGSLTPLGYEGEVNLKRGDNGWFTARVNAVDGPGNGELIMAVRDLTREKFLERELLSSKRLAGLGRVVEGVAHEVRNPLISIGGFARKVEKAAPEGTAEKEFMTIVLREVERLERMVEDIEGFVEFTNVAHQCNASVDMGKVLAASLEKVAGCHFASKKVRTSCKLLPEIMVFGSRELLEELFTLLIENAYDAMADGGGELDLRLDEIGGWARIVVGDTGTGIPESDLETIFEPFFTSKTRGVGLGLAKAHLIVEDHFGQIKYKSKVGEGTVCTVLIPVDRRKVVRKSH
jgi:PAS domain S-box-containing protein